MSPPPGARGGAGAGEGDGGVSPGRSAELARLLSTAVTAGADDAAARARVRAALLALRAAGALHEPFDQVAAAELLVDSDRREEVEAAQALALAAMARVPAARPLAAAAYDRLRVLAGRPQKFGTQRAAAGGGAPWSVDPATTDSERAKWGLPGLAELQRRATARE